MPFDSGSVVLSVSRRGVRRQPQHFPVLATQIRCSSGFTHAPAGRLMTIRAAARARAADGAAPGPMPAVADSATEVVLSMLLAAGPEGEMPSLPFLRQAVGGAATIVQVRAALAWLDAAGLILMEQSEPHISNRWMLVRIVATGEVLRTRWAPRVRGPQ